GISFASSATPGTTTTMVLSPSTTISRFVVDYYGAAYQTGGGTLYYVSAGSTTPILLSGTASCVALAVDGSGTYCRTAGPGGILYSWTTGGIGPTLVHVGLPQGTDLVANSSYYMFSNMASGVAGAGSIQYVTKTPSGDAGTIF